MLRKKQQRNKETENKERNKEIEFGRGFFESQRNIAHPSLVPAPQRTAAVNSLLSQIFSFGG